ncbi:rhodanese-like domain-containing protein [Nakamurella sp. YIM 132087]|uniref:Rhodanese-like domain-containing protein n=1 Tax=Nakamurella alba TaxID=2665158 RepID=A0A7K1FKV6_9ACTN|nr:rhodanese-like domain-containing protein [Nakamurella alba]MTD14726.1 rhodanese-like domain-containing protein [Nakamurella alba]
MTTVPAVPAAAIAWPATPASAAVPYFRAKLDFETDASDVAAALRSGTPGFVLVDSRGVAAWAQGHIPGAVHLPTAEIASRAADLIPAGTPVVTYCWGPGCNGGTRAALAFALLGHPVKEMIGGFEYWAREGMPVETASGIAAGAVDPLTAPRSTVTCDC